MLDGLYSIISTLINEIYFDANDKSQSGKWIPLNKDTGLPQKKMQSVNITI
jgi:hypothetical protein